MTFARAQFYYQYQVVPPELLLVQQLKVLRLLPVIQVYNQQVGFGIELPVTVIGSVPICAAVLHLAGIRKYLFIEVHAVHGPALQAMTIRAA